MNSYLDLKKNPQQGQGLIESLIIVLFIAVSVVTLLKFQHYLSYSTTYLQQQSDANILAVNQIEILRNFQVLNNLANYTSYQSIASSTGSSPVGNTTYTVTTTVTTTASPAYKTIGVTVAWTDRFGQAQSIQLNSDVAGIDPSIPGSFM